MSTDTLVSILVLTSIIVGFILFSLGVFRNNAGFLVSAALFYTLGFLITFFYFINTLFSCLL